MKRPYFPFYPKDWLNDPALKACSLEAKGVWIDMLCLMHEGNPYGYLTLPNGNIIDPKMLAKLIPNSDQNGTRWVRKCDRLVDELVTKGVLKRDENGVFYSKKMVSDEAERQSWRERQAKHRGKDVTEKSQPITSPITITYSNNNPPTPKGGEVNVKKEFDRFWKSYPRKENRPGAMKAFERAIRSADVSEILTGMETWQKSGKWDDPKFIPHAASFLNGRRWEDELGVKPSKGVKPLHKKLFEAETAENIFQVSDEPSLIQLADYEYVPKGYFGQDGLKHRKTGEILCLRNFRPVEVPKEVGEHG